LSIREIIIDWLTSSRYVCSLESRIQEQRQDYETRLAEKDQIIHDLKVDLAGLKLEADQMRLVLMPLGSPAGAAYAARFQGGHDKPRLVPAFSGTLDWLGELQKEIGKEEDGAAVNAEKQNGES
jgi:hypothetical protein